MTTRTVYNLAEDIEAIFMADVPPVVAVQLCAANDLNLVSKTLHLLLDENYDELNRLLPVITGKHSVACGDWATKL